MVTVPRYRSTQSLRGRNRQDLTANATPSAFGAEVGRGLQQLGQGIDSVAKALEAKEIIEAEANARNAENQYRGLLRSGLYDPETGYLNRTGAAAMGDARENTHENLAAARDRIAAGLDPRARRIFEQQVQQLDNSAKDSTIRHEGVEFRNFTMEAFEGAAQGHLDDAVIADSNGKFLFSLGQGKLEITRAGRLAGKPQEAIDQDIERYEATARSSRVVKLAEDNPIAAWKYLRKNEEEIKAGDPATYEKLRSGLEGAYYRSVARERVDAGGGVQGHDPQLTNTQLITYSNKNAVRNQPLSKRMTDAMSVLGDLGLGFEVISGGQPGIDEDDGNNRVGTILHDHGNAADGYFTKNGKRLSWANPGERAIVVEALQALKGAGMPGFGAGPGYMAEGMVHVGFGKEAVWGAEGAGENAPEWLKEAMAAVELGASPDLPPSSVGMTLSDAMRIEDPKLRDATIAEIEQRRGAHAADRQWRRTQTLEDAWKLIDEQGVNPADLPPDMQIELGQETMNGIFDTYERNQQGVDYTDIDEYERLFNMSMDDRQTFETTDLNEYRDVLNTAAYKELRTIQAELREQTTKVKEQGAASVVYDDADYRQAHSDAEEQYRHAAGIKPGGKMSADQHARYRRFQQQLRQGMNSHANETGRPMTFEERTNYVSTLLTPVIIEGVDTSSWPFYGGVQNLFDIPTFRSAFERQTDPRAEAQLDVVPPDERAQIEAEFMQINGRRPTDDEAVELYEDKLFLSVGLSPNVEWRDVPTELRRGLIEENPGANKDELAAAYKAQILELIEGEQEMGPRR